jgi:insulysin
VADRKLPVNRFPTVYLEQKPALRLITVDPVADVRSVSVEFPMPSVETEYRAKPLSLIGFVLGHEGKGSLLSLLKAEGLATSLSVGYGDGTPDYASFHATIGLTPQGLQRYQDVLAYLMGTVRQLREAGIPQYLYEENRIMSDLGFRYRERTGASQLASSMSALMQELPLEQLPAAAYLYQEYKPALYKTLLSAMRPDNMLVTLTAKGQPTSLTEQYYRARYGYQEITGAPYDRLVQALPDPRWRLPEPNPFIPKNTALVHPEGALKVGDATMNYLRADGVPAAVLDKLVPYLDVTFTSGDALVSQMQTVLTAEERQRYLPLLLKDSLALPSRLIDDGLAKVWYLPDWRYRQPKAEVVLKVFTEGAFRTPKDVVLARLYDASLGEAMDEFGYPVREAGLNFDIDTNKSGLTIRFGGYSSGLLALMEVLSGKLQSVDITPERFATVKERMKRGLENRRFDQPYEQSSYFRELLLQQPSVSREAQLAALGGISLPDVQAYAKQVYRRIYVQGVVVGNLDAERARAAVTKLFQRLGATPLPENLRVEEEIRALPARADQVFSERLDVNNSVLNAYYQAGQTEPRLRGSLLIVGRRLSDAYYQSLRTQQQLGYIVWAGMGQTKKTLNFTFIVQSGAYSADVLQDRTEQFIPGFIAEFKALPDAAFESYRAAVIQAKLERDHNLGEVAQRLFWTAFQNDAQWDYNSEDIRAVESLKRAAVERVLERVLAGDQRRRLVIRLIGKDHKARAPKGQVITLPAALRTASAQ